MKKLLLTCILFPSLIFGQCVHINEESLIGAEIKFLTVEKLLKNGKISENGSTSNHSWSFKKPVLKINREEYSYFFDLSSGLFNERINKTWCEKNGTSYQSGLVDWQKFDPDYYHLFYNINYKTCINNYISERIKIWERKGEFEKTIIFKERVNENTRKVKLVELEKQAVNFYKKNIIDDMQSSEIVLKEYNADNETFKMTIRNFEAINFPVPISKAESFKKNFNPSNFSNLDFIYAQDEFIVSKIDFDGFSYNLFSND